MNTNDGAGAADSEDLRKVLTALQIEINEAMVPYVPIVTSFVDLITAAGPKLQHVARGMLRTQELLDRWEKDAPTVLKEAISSQGLIVPISQMSFPDLVELVEIHNTRDDSAVVERIRAHYQEIFAVPNFLKDLEATWAADAHLERRLRLLRQTLKAHELGMYGVSIPTLLAQFEGLVADVTGHTGMMKVADLKAHVNDLTAGEKLTGGMLSAFVTDAFLAQFAHGSLIPPFSRHAILHGADVEYDTEVNSRTAILLIDHLRLLIEK